MSLRFKGGERLQRGRGIGGLLRLVKSLFTPLVKSAGKSIVKAATSNTGKAVLKSIKDQAIDSGIRLASDALRGGIWMRVYTMNYKVLNVKLQMGLKV